MLPTHKLERKFTALPGWGPLLIPRSLSSANQDGGGGETRAPRCRTIARHSATQPQFDARLAIARAHKCSKPALTGPALIAKTPKTPPATSTAKPGTSRPVTRPESWSKTHLSSWPKIIVPKSPKTRAGLAVFISGAGSSIACTTSAATTTIDSSQKIAIPKTITRVPSITKDASFVVRTTSTINPHTITRVPSITKDASCGARTASSEYASPMITRSASAAMEVQFQEIGLVDTSISSTLWDVSYHSDFESPSNM